MVRIAFFDFDGTMSKGDSLFAFVAFVHGRKRLYFGLLARFWILLGFMLGLVSNTYAKQCLMRYFFAGMRYEDFLGYCECFCAVLERRLKPAALERLLWHKDRGDRLVMVSASFEEYLAPLCKKLGMDCIATRLETIQEFDLDSRSQCQIESIDNSKPASTRYLSGFFATPNCYGKEKLIRIRASYDLSAYDEIYAYGDSKGDKEMLSIATHAFYRSFT